MRWRKKCKEFKNIRELIDNGDMDGIMNGLLAICRKYEKEDEDFCDDFAMLAEDVEFNLEDCEEETVDFYLEEFYDLCDSAGIWLCL